MRAVDKFEYRSASSSARRDVVDSPSDYPGRCRPKPHDSHSGPMVETMSRVRNVSRQLLQRLGASRRSKKPPAPPMLDRRSRRVLAMSRTRSSLRSACRQQRMTAISAICCPIRVRKAGIGAAQECFAVRFRRWLRPELPRARDHPNLDMVWATATATRWKKSATFSR